MEPKAVALFSGGLDSILAVRLLQEQDIEIHAFHMVLDFHAGLPGEHDEALERSAARLGVPLKRCYRPQEYLAIVRNPVHGYGKNLNPCIDCRLFLLRNAAEYMREIGASFLVTGEVVGERPMSQKRNTLRMIEKRAGLLGLILRPLSARLLEPTIPEQEGIVDRERLLDISGRSRKPQMALAERYGITEYPSPAGGCLLTDPGFSRRLRDLLATQQAVGSNDINLLKVGRHFRLSGGLRAVVGRDHADNEAILSLRRPGDVILRNADVPGPVTLCRGVPTDEALRQAAALTARYSKARDQVEVPMNHFMVLADGELEPAPTPLAVRPADAGALGLDHRL